MTRYSAQHASGGDDPFVHAPDPIRRFTPTPFAAVLSVMERSIRLETNDLQLLERATETMSVYAPSARHEPDFTWRIVVEAAPSTRSSWPPRSAFSGPGLRYVVFGQRNFIAVDLDSREAVGYLASEFVYDNPGFISPYLDNIFCLTAGALGLTPMFAGCVARGEAGVLVAGSPNNGKTSACYAASMQGLEFHADRAVFLETCCGQLQAWGDFWPAAFRPDIAGFYPDVPQRSRTFQFGSHSFLYMDRSPYQPRPVRSVIPVCSVFLDRRPGTTARVLARLSHGEIAARVKSLVSFQDDHRFEIQQKLVLEALANVPAYDLVCPDPGVAAAFLPQLLARHALSKR